MMTVDDLIQQARQRRELEVLAGDTYKDLSTIIIIPTPWKVERKTFLNCHACQAKNEYTQTNLTGLNPAFISSLKNLVKPMNVACVEMYVPGREVGDAYSTAVEMILANPTLAQFKYVLTIEHDNLVPFMPGTLGPLCTLYEHMDQYDVIGALYRLKGEPPTPLIYGDPATPKDSPEGMFRVRYDWKVGDLVPCNGLGMGFTLFKLDIFKDTRLTKPFFKSVAEHQATGPSVYTQDLYFFEKIKALGYQVAVDTRVVVAHMDLSSGEIF